MRSLFIVMLAGLIVFPLGSIFAQTETQEGRSKTIAELIGKLGSKTFKEREVAQQELIKIGEPARVLLVEATRNKDAEVVRRAKVVLDEIRKSELAGAEVHVVGLYESRRQKAIVEVRATKNPIILVLCAYESVVWKIEQAENTRLLQVIASGYHKQTVEGVDVPVSTYSYDERSRSQDGQSLYFYTYDHDEDKYPNMVAKVRQLTGKKVTWFQGRYGFKKVPFVIGGAE